MAKLQNGRIAVVASGFRIAHICPFGKTVISYCEDNGETYTCPAPVIDTVLDDGTLLTVFIQENPKKHRQLLCNRNGS